MSFCYEDWNGLPCHNDRRAVNLLRQAAKRQEFDTTAKSSTMLASASCPKLDVRSWRARSPSSFLVLALPQKLPHHPPPPLFLAASASTSCGLMFALSASRLRFIYGWFGCTLYPLWCTLGQRRLSKEAKEVGGSRWVVSRLSAVVFRAETKRSNHTQPRLQGQQQQHRPQLTQRATHRVLSLTQ